MKLPRNLSGREVVEALVRSLGRRVVHQRGSHVVLETEEPSRRRIVVPDHSSLRMGSLSAIVRAVSLQKDIEKAKVVALLTGSS